MLHVLALLAAASAQPIVSTQWLQAHLSDPQVRVIYVGERDDYNQAHIPRARLLWQELFADQRTQKFRSPDEIRALLARAGVAPGQDVVTYCAVGMRASLMYWAVRAVGVNARVYVGSWQDWSRDSKNPVVR